MRPEHSRTLLVALALVVWTQGATAQPVSTTAERPPDERPAPEPVPAVACPGIVLRSTPAFLFSDGFESGDASAWWREGTLRLSARQILDLELEVQLDEGVAGDHLLHLELETPKGHLYQRLTVPFSTSSKAAATRKIAGHPRPLRVQRLATRGPASPPAVSFSLPVAGTPIVHSSLYGRWRARPFLDDATNPCGKALTFELIP